jgi:hypothetical protein
LKPDGHTKMRGAWERFWKLTRLNKANISVERDGVLSLLVAEYRVWKRVTGIALSWYCQGMCTIELSSRTSLTFIDGRRE